LATVVQLYLEAAKVPLHFVVASGIILLLRLDVAIGTILPLRPTRPPMSYPRSALT
jgi:hypothetical protein